MGAEKHWHLVCYDIRDPKRWKKVFKKLKGTGDHVQYSIFRVHLTVKQLERLRWELEGFMAEEDDLLIIRLCSGCAQRVIDSHKDRDWKKSPAGFDVF